MRRSRRCWRKPGAAKAWGLLMRLAIIRQRYTPYGGAERFVERALDALARRGVELALVTRRWPRDGDPARDADHRRPAVSRPNVARQGIRARRLRDACPHAGHAGAIARTHRMLRHLSCRRWRARGMVRGAHPRRGGVDTAGDRARPLSSLRAGGGAAPLCEPAPAPGDLQFAHGADGNPRALRPAARAPADHLQRHRRHRVQPGSFRPSGQRARAIRHRRRRLRVPARGLGVCAQRCRSRAGGAGRRPGAGPFHRRRSRPSFREIRGPRAALRCRALASPSRDRKRIPGPITAPPTRSCCRHCTTRSPTPYWKRWPADCPS